MKKFCFVLSLIILLLVLCSGCNIMREIQLFIATKDKPLEQVLVDEYLEKLIKAIECKDINKVKALFSKETVSSLDDFDESILLLFDYYQGELVSYEDKGLMGEVTLDYGDKQEIQNPSYDLETSTNNYRISFQVYITDTFNERNVGIHSLYIIKAEDDTDLEFAYSGDGLDTPGINIGIKNTLPQIEE